MSKPPALSKVLTVMVLLASVLVWVAVYSIGMAMMFWPESGGFDRQLRTFADGLARVAEAHRDPATLGTSLSDVGWVVAEFAGDTAPWDTAGFNLRDAQGHWQGGPDRRRDGGQPRRRQ